MKILLLGDLHLCYRGPSSRTDDFFQTQVGKFNQVIEIYKREGCEALIQAGDFFDNPRPPNFLMATYIDMLKKAGIVVHCVLGQHDISMHNLDSVARSAIHVFEKSEVLKVLDNRGTLFGDVSVYGASWGEDVPTPDRNRRAILVCHKMIGDAPLYPGHDPIRPKSFVHTHSGYELILCGDYHYRFLECEQSRKIVNCGSLVRLSCAERDMNLVPAVAVYDTISRGIVFQELQFTPSSEIFIVSQKEEKTVRESILALVEQMRASKGITVSFRDNLQRFFVENQTPADIQIEINGAIEEVGVK